MTWNPIEEPLCWWCGAEAVAWCDFSLGFTLSHEDGLIHLRGENESEHFTCDAAMCADHRNVIGHMCARREKDCDLIDHCPAHVGKTNPGVGDTAFSSNREAARKVRRGLKAKAARGRIALVR